MVECSTVKRSKAKYFFIMTHQEFIKASRQRKLVEDDKFDRQTEEGISRSESRKTIQSSIY